MYDDEEVNNNKEENLMNKNETDIIPEENQNNNYIYEKNNENNNSNLNKEESNKSINNTSFDKNQIENIINVPNINKLSLFNKNNIQIDDDINNRQKDIQAFNEIKNNNVNNKENDKNNIDLNMVDNNQIDLENEINNEISEKDENKNGLMMQDENIENINEDLVNKEYSTENLEENINKENIENNDDEEIKFNSNIIKEDNLNDENENELINYKNISDSEKVQNTNENKIKEIEQKNQLSQEMIQKFISRKNDGEVLELYSFEDNEKDIKNNENMNEEYFINQNMINYENKNIINNTNQIDNKINAIIENQKYKTENKITKKIINEINSNSEQKNSDNINEDKLELYPNKNNNIKEENDEIKEGKKKKKKEFKQKESIKNEKLLNGKDISINADNKEIINKKGKDNKIKINPEKTKKLNFGIYKKNMQQILFKKFTINTSKKSDNKPKLELKLENPKINNEKEIFYNKYKTINIQENNNNKSNKKQPFQINTNINKGKNKIKNSIESYYKTAYIPYNNYIQFFNKTSHKNKNIKNTLSKVDEQKSSFNQSIKIKDYSFDGVVYQKRNVKNPNFLISSTSRVYSKKKKLNRKNTFGKNEIIQNINDSNENINNKIIKKEKININVNQLYSPNNYSKKIPISGQNRVSINNKNMNKIIYNNENNDNNTRNNNYENINLKRYNNNMNLFNSKNNNSFKYKMKMMYNTNNVDLSNDDIYNKYTPKIYINNMNNNTNYRQKENKGFNYYQRNMNIYNTMKNYPVNNKIKGINQFLPHMKKNIVMKNKYFNDEYHYYDNQYEDNIYDENNYYYNSINNSINNGVKIDIEDLIVLEEKLNEIIYFLKTFKNMKNQCYDFWNFLFYSSIKKLEKVYSNKKIIDIIKLSVNLELLSVMVCYEFSFDEVIINKTYILLLEILEINHNNLILICENILLQSNQDNQKNIWIQLLNKIIFDFKNESDKYSQKNILFHEKINSNNDKLLKKIKNILYYYQTEYSSLISSLSKKINEKNYEQINDFFQEYIFRKDSDIDNKDSNINQARPPFILSKRKKKFTLILSLDETLIHLQQINYNQCSLKLRPYLIEFLENMKPYYELILFTSKTKYYANPALDVIQRNKKYFDFIFYREHCIFIDNNYVKDLTRIGRSLDSTIIIDNYPQHFKLQKENGIYIKSFWAQNPNDRTLYDLIPILINIALDEIDVRDGLEKYKVDIVGKITSNVLYNSQTRY